MLKFPDFGNFQKKINPVVIGALGSIPLKFKEYVDQFSVKYIFWNAT